MKPRYVDANKLLDRVFDVPTCYEEGREVKDEIITIIADFRAADVEEVEHGRWIRLNQMSFFTYDSFYQCSECQLETTNTTNYCPNCGAKMDGKRNEDG